MRNIGIVILLTFTISAYAEMPADFILPPHEMNYVDSVELQVNNEDTFYLAKMHEIWVYPKIIFKNKKQERFYWKTVRDVKKTLPFAKLLTIEMEYADKQLAQIPDKKLRKKWWKQHEKYLFTAPSLLQQPAPAHPALPRCSHNWPSDKPAVA